MVISADVAFLAELEPTAKKLLERHLGATKEWHPHALVPYSRGRDFEADYEWSPDEANVPADIRSALFVNLLTEDNLPYYFRDIERMFGRDGAWGEWVRRWTAEEVAMPSPLRLPHRHPQYRPRFARARRMIQMSGGQVPSRPELPPACSTSPCKNSPRISHRNTGKRMEDPAGYDIMRRIAQDENHHFLFYRDIALGRLRNRSVRHGHCARNGSPTSLCPVSGSPALSTAPKQLPTPESTTSLRTTSSSRARRSEVLGRW
ncbi:MAG: acyl-ACP desaturase [Acidimicrobiales bacterium]